MASRLGIAVTTYNRYETGKREPKASILIGLHLIGSRYRAEWILLGEEVEPQEHRSSSAREGEPQDSELILSQWIRDLVQDLRNFNRFLQERNRELSEELLWMKKQLQELEQKDGSDTTG